MLLAVRLPKLTGRQGFPYHNNNTVNTFEVRMDIDTPCIPLAHIQTYFDLRQTLVPDAEWL